MTWPASNVVTTNMDAGADSAASARSDLLDLVQKFNLLRAHVTTFMQTFLGRTDAAGARGDLGLANHQLVTVDASANLATTGTVTGGNLLTTGNATVGGSVTATATVTGATLNSTGNITASGNITATGNVTAYSDERLKDAWEDIDPEFTQFLAQVRAGTFQLKAGDGRRLTGVSAQSLRQLLPEAVVEDEDGLLSVAYGNAALVACVALARELQRLRAEVAQLKGAR